MKKIILLILLSLYSANSFAMEQMDARAQDSQAQAASILPVPDEILRKIFCELINDQSYSVNQLLEKLKELALVSRQFHRVARPFVLQIKGINFIDRDASLIWNFVQAANYNDLITLMRILGLVTNPNIIPTGHKCNALHCACSKGYSGIVRNLLSHPDIDPNVRTNNDVGNVPLHFVVSNEDNDINILNALLAHPKTDPNIRTKDNSSALGIASDSNLIKMIKVLLKDLRINPNEIHRDGCSQIYGVIFFGQVEIVKAFLVHPNIRPNFTGRFDFRTNLEFAIKTAHEKYMQAIVAKDEIDPDGKDLNDKEQKWKIYHDYIEIIRALLGHPEVLQDLKEHFDFYMRIRMNEEIEKILREARYNAYGCFI